MDKWTITLFIKITLIYNLVYIVHEYYWHSWCVGGCLLFCVRGLEGCVRCRFRVIGFYSGFYLGFYLGLRVRLGLCSVGPKMGVDSSFCVLRFVTLPPPPPVREPTPFDMHLRHCISGIDPSGWCCFVHTREKTSEGVRSIWSPKPLNPKPSNDLNVP
jgi:hypothetical protein